MSDGPDDIADDRLDAARHDGCLGLQIESAEPVDIGDVVTQVRDDLCGARHKR